MKRMTRNQFMKKYIYGLNNFISHGQTKYYQSEITFTPEHQWMDILLSYKYPCIAFYNKKHDATLLFIQCVGMISLDICNGDKEGIAMAFHGNKVESLLQDLLKSKKFLALLTEEYYKYRDSLRSETDTDAAKERDKDLEEFHKSSEDLCRTFEDFSEAIDKIKEKEKEVTA